MILFGFLSKFYLSDGTVKTVYLKLEAYLYQRNKSNVTMLGTEKEEVM